MNILRKLFILLILIGQAQLAWSKPANEEFESIPLSVSGKGTPLVMIAMSNDHQLFYKAYTDYDDIDGDEEVDSTYKHEFDYYGYFDPYRCYTYADRDWNSKSNPPRFVPAEIETEDKYCDGAGLWSGNFLNWATMTRIDAVRKILYGGHRVVDNTETDGGSLTVLQRSYLPTDAHSFAKYIKSDSGLISKLTGITGEEEITICNTSIGTDKRAITSGLSQNVDSVPVMRIVKGNYQLWNAGERWQCRYSDYIGGSGQNGNVSSITGLKASPNSPSVAEIITELVVNVEACSYEGRGCTVYPDNSIKPIGLLQEFGKDDKIKFGLMTGSYGRNKSGGVLRKNIGYVSDEFDANTGRILITAEDNSDGFVSALDRLRITRYNYGNGTYNSSDGCSWNTDWFREGHCSNWGNPMSEILAECVNYFGDKGPTPGYHADDRGYIDGLRTAAWENPIDEEEPCASLNVVVLNASTISFDGDLSRFNRNFGINVSDYTDDVGRAEIEELGLLHSPRFFVGGVGEFADDGQCTAKNVTRLSQVRGTCPDAPRLSGSYQMAGVAKFARDNDLSELDGEQKIKTFGVSLSPALPSIDLERVEKDDEGRVIRVINSVSIIPACRNRVASTVPFLWTYTLASCAIVDFKVVTPFKWNEEGQISGTGKYFVQWEDSEFGGDYDMDMHGIFDVEWNGDDIKVSTTITSSATSGVMGFGYVISGTRENDGYHNYNGLKDYGSHAGTNCPGDCGAGRVEKTFKVGESLSAKFLKPPLYYAAKWGGETAYDEINNLTGRPGSDGDPDNYALAVNPRGLELQLDRFFRDILGDVVSNASSNAANNDVLSGSIQYQALYYPYSESETKVVSSEPDADDSELSESIDDVYEKLEVSWVGSLRAVFRDAYGFQRSDDNGNGILEDIDPIIESTRLEGGSVLVTFYPFENGSKGDTAIRTGTFASVKPIWDARDHLNNLHEAKDVSLDIQRVYSDNADKGRYIITSVPDTDTASGIKLVDFDVKGFTEDNDYSKYLWVDPSEVENTINFIRGLEIDGYRNRRVDYDEDGVTEQWLIGDIVNSSPLLVGAPKENYYIRYGDSSYRDFQEHYANRRPMLYVGSNDGMLHAFNPGFEYQNEAGNNVVSHLPEGSDEVFSSLTAHPLGSEIWAYVPFNLLPHLSYLTSPFYQHMYYVDGSPVSYDVNIFEGEDPDIYPGGWGTILVVGMRFGGSPLEVDFNDGGSSTDWTSGSAYIVLDVTDPERPPRLLAEISHPDLGYTLARPELIKNRSKTNNDWHLVFGSGPQGENALSRAESDTQGTVFVYDLKIQELSVLSKVAQTNSFIGELESVDWDGDYADDVAYFGVTMGSVEEPRGVLKRLKIATDDIAAGWTVNDMYFSDNPIFSRPTTYRSGATGNFVLGGTGRILVEDDLKKTLERNYLFGVRESSDFESEAEDLVDVSDIYVYTDGTILNGDDSPVSIPNPDGTSSVLLANEKEITQFIVNRSGWRQGLTFPPATGLLSDEEKFYSGRLNHTVEINSGDAFALEYKHNFNICAPGESHIRQFSPATGLPPSDSYLRPRDDTDTDTDTDTDGAMIETRKVADGFTGPLSFLTVLLPDPKDTGTDTGTDVIPPPGCDPGLQPQAEAPNDSADPSSQIIEKGCKPGQRSSWSEITIDFM